MSEITISSGSRNWGSLSVEGISGIGRVHPRLLLNLKQHPFFAADVELVDTTLRLTSVTELIGQARIADLHLSPDSYCSVEVPTSQRMLEFVTDGLTAAATSVALTATLEGRGRARIDPNRASSPGLVRFVGEPEFGEWGDVTLSSAVPSNIQVPRSQWYESVLKPCQNESYIYLEIALPVAPSELAPEWQTAVGHLQSAERAYALGDDPTVFLHLRGALDALPGAKRRIFDAISDPDKREAMDTMVKSVGDFLHRGRHISVGGSRPGEFAVDHLDSALALDMMRTLLAHLSLMLPAHRERQ